MEQLENVKFLRIHITSDVPLTHNSFFLRQRKRTGLSSELLNFHKAPIESMICISVVQELYCPRQKGTCCGVEHRTGHWGQSHPTTGQDGRVLRRAGRIAADPTHLGHKLSFLASVSVPRAAGRFTGIKSSKLVQNLLE